MASKLHRWDNWTGGEYGLLRPENQGKDMWSGLNFVLYDDGRLGPRTGFGALSAGALSAVAATQADCVGFGGGTWFVYSGTNVYTYEQNPSNYEWLAGTAAPGAVAIGHRSVFVRTAPDVNYLLTPGNGLHSCTRNSKAAATVAAITTTVFGTLGDSACLYRERMYVSDDGATGVSRVRYSAANDYTSWSADDYFDVGNESPVAWMGWSGDRLVIIKQNMEIWAYTGTPGRDTLKRVNGPQVEIRVSHNLGGRIGMTKNGDIWAIKPNLTYPHKLVNNKFVGMPHLSLFPDYWTGYPFFPFSGSITSTTGNDDMIMVVRAGDLGPGNTGYWRWAWFRNGAWTFHTLNSGAESGGLETTTGILMIYSDGIYESLALVSGHDRAYVMHNNVNQPPGPVGGTTWPAGDKDEVESVVCELNTSTYIVPRMRETRVNKVVVEFESPNAGYTGFTVGMAVSVIGAAADGEEVTMSFGSWASVSGDREGNYRVVFTPDGDIPVTQFRVKLVTTGLVIAAVTASMEEDDEDTRG